MSLLVSLAFASAPLPGTFDHEHSAFTRFLDGAVSEAGVDYDSLAKRRELLSSYVDSLSDADLSEFSSAQQLAFWVNAYNAHTIGLILDHLPLNSIRDLDGGEVWKKRSFQVAGAALTLDQMEHEHARKLADGRVHAVVNCAAKGCPPLPPRALHAEGLEAQLDVASARWARSNGYLRSGDDVALNNIFTWYAEDFVAFDGGDLPGVDGAHEDALWFLSRYVDAEERAVLTSGRMRTSILDYDWSLNRR